MARRGPKASTRAKVIPRKRRERGTPFGRASQIVTSGELTDLGCPDCRGVLAVREEGHQGHLAFTCSIGHAYSGESLVRGKEEQAENTLWSAVEVYQEIALLHGEMSARVRAAGVREDAEVYRTRGKRATGVAAELRRIIAQDSPASADRGKG